MLFELTTDIETFTEISKGDLLIITETFDINTVVMEVVNEFEFTCQMKGIQLQWDLAKIQNTMIHTDRERLKQILMNLVSNSIQFTNRGFVKIIVQQEQEGIAKVIVEDTGEGMNDVQREYLMKRFKNSFRSAQDKLEGNNEDFGFGLIICYHLAKYLAPISMADHFNIQTIKSNGTKITFFVDTSDTDRVRKVEEFDLDINMGNPFFSRKKIEVEPELVPANQQKPVKKKQDDKSQPKKNFGSNRSVDMQNQG